MAISKISFVRSLLGIYTNLDRQYGVVASAQAIISGLLRLIYFPDMSCS